jgi:hypothetical protein
MGTLPDCNFWAELSLATIRPMSGASQKGEVSRAFGLAKPQMERALRVEGWL